MVGNDVRLLQKQKAMESAWLSYGKTKFVAEINALQPATAVARRNGAVVQVEYVRYEMI